MAITPVIGAGYIAAVVDLAAQINAGGASVQAADITDSTAIGRTVLTAADASAVRTAIGTVAATTTVAGIVEQAEAQAAFAGADAAAIVVELNAFLAKLVAAGIVAP
jgi:hypothetical protein